ncbi:MAG TPA: glycosyltransferase, partial [Candidatus Methylomirabilis sp.]|nr:glycosyltransferase [Candidatus Methylomirabilis sp.]
LGIDPAYGTSRNLRGYSSTPLILGIGRLVEKKGFRYLLGAAELLKKRGVSFRCILIGEGPERARLGALSEHLNLDGIVEFAGALSNDRVREYLAPPNLLVAPSVYASDGERDGIPTVLVEAMACGVPVVSTRVSGIPELISNKENGLLVPDRDEVALADAIGRLLTDAALRDRLTEEGRKTVYSRFDIHQSSRKLWSLIEAASGRP